MLTHFLLPLSLADGKRMQFTDQGKETAGCGIYGSGNRPYSTGIAGKDRSVKREESQLTYADGQYLYLAKGYGTRESSGYNISVKDLYLTEHTIVFETQISGPTEGEDVSRRETTPYIVVKTEILDGQVVFQ